MHHPQFAGRNVGDSPRGIMGDALSELDWAMKKIVYALHENKLNKNTLIWFTSDNGYIY